MKVKTKNVVSSTEKMLHIVFHIVLIALAVSCLYPFLVILGSSFQSQQEILTSGYSVIPKEFTTEAYKLIF